MRFRSGDSGFSFARWPYPLLPLLLIWLLPSALPAAQNLALAWRGIQGSEVVAYRIYYGYLSRTYGSYVEVPAPAGHPEFVSTMLEGLNPGRKYFFFIAALSAEGTESGPSEEISYTVPVPGRPPDPPPVDPPDDEPPPPPPPPPPPDPDDGDPDGPALWAAAAGVYNGLFSRTDEVRHEHSGSFTITATARGAYSGRALVGGQRLSFSGELAPDGRATNVFPRGDGESLRIEFELGGDENRAVGWVVGESWVAPMEGDRNRFNPKTNPASFAGSYTVTLPPPSGSPVGPRGHGYGTVKIDTRGTATFVGTMADGTRCTQRIALSSQGHWPFHVLLYKGLGSALGWLVVSRGDVGGLVYWIRPAGTGRYQGTPFTLQSSVVGSRFIPLSGADGPVRRIEIVCRGGGLLEPVNGDVLLLSNGRISVRLGDSVRFGISISTGLFKGTIEDPASGSLLSFNGVLLQKWNVGSGVAVGPGAIGYGYVGISVD